MRVLVSVSSRHGGTAELGRRVASGLRDAGHRVDETAPDDVGQVSGYDAVVLGTSVYVGRAGLDLKDLVERQVAALRGRPVWVFWSGPVADDPETLAAPEDVAELVRVVGARGVQVFGGRAEWEHLTVTEKSLLALVDPQPGDHRDLQAAEAWGLGIGESLAVPRSAAR